MAKHRQLLFEDERWRPLFSSRRGDWETPQDLFDTLDAEFHFTLDVSATPSNAKCASYFTSDMDGLKQVWTGVIWMNPPYGRDIGRWVKKAFDAAITGATCVCLLPVRSDTKWWHDFVTKGEVRFVRGRVKFAKARTGAPFPSAIVVFRPGGAISTPAESDAVLTLFDAIPRN